MTPRRPPRERSDAERALHRTPEAPRAPRADASDPAAEFDALVTDHYARLCNFAYRYVGSRAAAEDVVQDVFTKIWERGGRLECRDPVQYLYRAVRNRAISQFRHERAGDRLHSRILAQSPAAAPAAPAAELECDELAAAVARAVAGLPERCRLVYTLSRDQGLSYAEIARVLGISVKTVEVQMYRAFKALRHKVAPYLSLLLVVRAFSL